VLKTRWLVSKKKEPGWFGAVQLKKNYVSYHLMPLNSLPVLADDISPELKKRMQGKSCFNFKTVEPRLEQELEELTVRCATAYAAPLEPKPHS
jgi:hypothetical protein